MPCLVHSLWAPSVRIHLTSDIISRTAAQSNARSKSSLLTSSRLRYPRCPPAHSVFEVSTLSSKPASSTPPTPEQTSVNCAKEGKHDLANEVRRQLLELGVKIKPSSVYEVVGEDMLQNKTPLSISAFWDWLALLPDEEEPGANAFRRIRELLLTSPKENLPFIKQFGLICASKGYTSILLNDILPIVSYHTSPEAHATFIGELQVAAGKTVASLSPAKQMERSAVIEDALYKYDTSSESTPGQSSILRLVEETLPNPLPQPLPDDRLVFEDASNPEYALYSTASPSFTPNSLIDNLHSLVDSKAYDEAFRILKEIRDLDIPIPTHWCYFRAARNVLRSSDRYVPLSQEQVDAFASWVSLIPPVHHTSRSVTFMPTWKLIFYAPIINVDLARRFALILASKGFAQQIVYEALPFIIKLFPWDACHRFIIELENANKEYWTRLKPTSAFFRTRKLIALAREVAVKNLLSSGRLEEAVALLPDIKSNPFPWTRSTYAALLECLRKSNDSAVEQYISIVATLRRDQRTLFSWNVHNEYPPVAAAVGSRPVASTEMDTNLPEHFKIAVESKEDFPHYNTLVKFIKQCFDNDKIDAILALRNMAFSSGPRNASAFIFSEMVYYIRQGWHDIVIQTFVNYHFLAGVPQDEVVARCYRMERIQAQAEDHAKPSTSLLFKRNPNAKKLWPRRSHCSLVWHSLVKTVPDHAALERLYTNLVQRGLHGRNATHTLTDIRNPFLTAPNGQSYVEAAQFVPFIRSLMQAFGADRGVLVLADMLKIGLAPGIYHYTELAGQYARTGDSLRAFKVLEQMERMYDKRTVPPGRSISLPPPDVVMYISLIAGFVISRDVQSAEEVVRRLQMRHSYVPGDHPALDVVLHRLDFLRNKLRY
ncbi:hypothetical protein L208DRAFT_1434278 [Tricholoma matsutake]|nr:hypothetical protein L208DRAFT_1434278 [Tricholoma matsutake 945]